MKKEKIIKEYRIKIDKVRKIKKIIGGEEYVDKLFLVDIKNCYGGGIGFSVKVGKDYSKSLRKVFKEIQRELYLIK